MKKIFTIFLAACMLVPLAVLQPRDAMAAINGDAVVEFLNSVIQNGNEMLSKARSSSDVALMDCINNQLINAKGFLNVAQTSSRSLKDAQAKEDPQAVAHNEKLLELASSKGHEIDTNIKQCASGVVKFSGDTTLTVHHDCKYEPCQKDPAKDPATVEGLREEDKGLLDRLAVAEISPYL